MDCKADKIRLWIHLEGAWMFQIDFMISKRLDVRKVNWRGVKASGSISARIWEQVGSNHALPPLSRVHTSIAHHCVLNCNYLVQLHIHMKSWYFNLLQWIDIPESVHISGADTSLARQLAKSCKLKSLVALLSYAHACFAAGGGMFAYMHACQAYLRHANYHCSLQNRAPVLPSGAPFEYFLLSPFLTWTAIYLFTPGSWRYHQTKLKTKQLIAWIWIPYVLMSWSVPMPGSFLVLTKSSISFAFSCWLQAELFCKPHRRVTISMTSEN